MRSGAAKSCKRWQNATHKCEDGLERADLEHFGIARDP